MFTGNITSNAMTANKVLAVTVASSRCGIASLKPHPRRSARCKSITSSLGSSKFQTTGPRGRKLIVETTTTSWTTLSRLQTSRFPMSQAKGSASSVSDRLERTILATITSKSIRWKSSERFARNKHKSFLSRELLFFTA